MATIDDSVPPATGAILVTPVRNNFKAIKGRIDQLPDALDGGGNQCTPLLGRVVVIGAAGAKVAGSGDTVDFAGAAARGAILAITQLTANATLDAQHAAHLIVANSTSDIVLTVDGSAIPIGWYCSICRANIGEVAIATTGGITLRHPDNHTRVYARYDMVSLIKISASDLLFAGRTKP